MKPKKLIHTILIAIMAIGAILGSLSHATRGDSAQTVEVKAPQLDMIEVALPPKMQSELTEFLLQSEPPDGMFVLTLDGKVVFLRAETNSIVRTLMKKMKGQSTIPDSDKRQEEPNQKDTDGEGGRGSKQRVVEPVKRPDTSGGES